MDNVGLILVGHGSRLPQHRENIEKLAEILRSKSRFKLVESAFMIRNRPSITEALDRMARKGVKKVVVIPVFMTLGSHTLKDIPKILGLGEGKHVTKWGDMEVIYGDPLGSDIRIAEIIEEKALEALGEITQPQMNPNVQSPDVAANAMFETSVGIIRSMLREVLEKVPEKHARIIERVVHATADPDFANLIVIDDRAVGAGVKAIKSGAKVITDVKMVMAGISAAKLRRFGGKVICYTDDIRVSKLASEWGLTRTAAAMRLAIDDGLNGAIVVIGNSPTATFELVKAVKKGEAKPALIIATPVGFVKSAEAKEAVMKLGVPFISLRGFKGGSPVAAAIFNALLVLAEETD
jgi:precorrin-8X/cobalt-precorrin-8 methylmutase